MAKLTATRIDLPPVGKLDALFARQLGPRLAQLKANPAEVGPNLTRLRFTDERGVDRFEACLFLDEDGVVFRIGTTDKVACFSQSSISECDDDELAEQLEAALREFCVAEFTRPQRPAKRARRARKP